MVTRTHLEPCPVVVPASAGLSACPKHPEYLRGWLSQRGCSVEVACAECLREAHEEQHRMQMATEMLRLRLENVLSSPELYQHGLGA